MSIRDCEKQDLHRWIAEKADSHECLESLDGFPGCEDVDCLLRIVTTRVQEVDWVCALRNNISTNNLLSKVMIVMNVINIWTSHLDTIRDIIAELS